MIHMRRNEFYLLIYLFITGTAFFCGVPELPLLWLSVIIGGFLFWHFKRTQKVRDAMLNNKAARIDQVGREQ